MLWVKCTPLHSENYSNSRVRGHGQLNGHAALEWSQVLQKSKKSRSVLYLGGTKVKEVMYRGGTVFQEEQVCFQTSFGDV